MSAYQKFFDESTVMDYDLVEMVKTASEKVKTQKLLLVAHSQGNFYANSFYDTVASASGGVPKESIGVYGVATPAARVAGGGKWLTSDTDKVIADAVSFFSFRNIMKPNTSIARQDGDDWLMHDFSNIYLKYRGDRIVSDIQVSLDRLQQNTVQDAQKPCIATPKQGIVHAVEGAALAAGDAVGSAIVWTGTSAVSTVVAFANAQQTAGTALGNGVVASVGLMQQVGSALGNAFVWVGTAVVNTVKDAGSSFLALVYSVPVPPASSLIAGALPVGSAPPSQGQPVPEQKPASAATDFIPQTPSSDVVIAQTTSIPTNDKGNSFGDAAVSVADAAFVATTSTTEVITALTPEIIAATSTSEIAVAPTVSRGGGSVTGVSADDLLKQALAAEALVAAVAQSQNTGTSTQDMATSTEDIATSTEPEIVYRDPVVINEIAWMGTSAQANDEWIELYNKTNGDIDLTGWTLESKNQQPLIALSGIIPARGYFLLERTASTTDQQENITYSSSIPDSGYDANLYLKNGTTTVDAVNFGNWPFGDNTIKRTMERVSPYATSTLYYNWKTYSEALAAPVAKDADGNDIFGTPKAKNSVAGFYTPTGDIVENTIWYRARSPYFVPAPMTVREGATLTIEPGVTVKFAKGASYGGQMDIRGVLAAQGILDKPIIFTSFFDDASDGVDSNQDGAATGPASADWMNINFYSTTTASVMRYAKVTYGGQGINYNPNGWYPTYTGAVGIFGTRPEISDTAFAFNHAVSVYVKDAAHPLLLRNTIRDTVVPTHAGAGPGGFGIQIADASSTADIISNTFENNTVAIRSSSAAGTALTVKDNTFRGNQKAGEFVGFPYFNLENSGNMGEGEFIVSSLRVGAGDARTIRGDTMPYVFSGGFTVEEGGTLIIEPGAILKSEGSPFVVRGTLTTRGTEAHPIIFTGRNETPGAWENIQFLGASSSDSVLEYVSVQYGGRGTNLCPYAYFGGPCMEYKGAVLIDGASPTITRATFDKNIAIAVYLEGSARPAITDSSLLNTVPGTTGPYQAHIAGYGISIGAESAPTLEGNTYSGNIQDVVYR